MIRLVPFFVFSEHRIQACEQFTHTGNQRFLSFSSLKQAHIKYFYHRGTGSCDKRSHIKRSSDSVPSTKDSSSASHGCYEKVVPKSRFMGSMPTSALIAHLRKLPSSGTSASSAVTAIVAPPFNAAQSGGQVFKMVPYMAVHAIINSGKLALPAP